MQMKNKGIEKETKLLDADIIRFVPFYGVTSLVGLPKNVWYIELFQILDYQQKRVYNYNILFESVFKEHPVRKNGHSNQSLNCQVSNLHLEKLIDKVSSKLIT